MRLNAWFKVVTRELARRTRFGGGKCKLTKRTLRPVLFYPELLEDRCAPGAIFHLPWSVDPASAYLSQLKQNALARAEIALGAESPPVDSLQNLPLGSATDEPVAVAEPVKATEGYDASHSP